MTAAMALPQPLAREVLRNWGWKTSALALLVGALTLVAMGTPLAPSQGQRKYFIPLLYNVLQFGFPLVFAAQWADRAVDRGARPLWAYLSVVVGVALVGTWPIARLLWPLLGREPYWDHGNDIWLFFNALLYHGLGVGAYAQWRGARIARERLHTGERDRAAQQRLLTTARLLALQARVEPQLLFDALARIDKSLAEDGTDAERRLAHLIDLLRAMQPAAQARASTLGRERALVEAYARVSGEVGLQPGWLQFDFSDEAAHASIAPLVLLPLLRGLAAVPTWRWQVHAVVADARLRVALAAPGAGSASFLAAVRSLEIDVLRQRLVDAHGADALLRVDASVPRLLIEVGCEDDAHPDR